MERPSFYVWAGCETDDPTLATPLSSALHEQRFSNCIFRDIDEAVFDRLQYLNSPRIPNRGMPQSGIEPLRFLAVMIDVVTENYQILNHFLSAMNE